MSTPTTHDALRWKLQQRAAELRQDLRQGRVKFADDARDAHAVLDRKDAADVATQSGIDDAEVQRDLTELAQVEAALQRMDGGRYGHCQDCGEPIAAERLVAQPWAARCLACQTRSERQSPHNKLTP